MSISAGSILVTSDAGDTGHTGDAVILDPATGTVLSSLSFIYARTGDRLPSGVIGIGKETSSTDGTILGVNLYDAQLNLISAVAVTGSGNPETSPVGGNTSDSFYIAMTPFGFTTASTLHRIASDGTLSGTTWSLPTSATPNSNAMIGLAPSADNRWVYYTVQPPSGDELRSFDLVNNVPGPTLVTLLSSEAFIQPGNLLTLASGNLLVFLSTANDTAFEVRQYSTSGALIATYPLDPASANGDAPEIFRDRDPFKFWVRTFPDGTLHTSLFTQYDLTSGLALAHWTVTNLNGGGQVPATCPCIVMGVGSTSPAPFIGTRQTLTIRRERTIALPILPGNAKTSISRLELQFQPGTGTPADPTVDPKFFVQMSWNNGKTWSNERLMSAGREGAYVTRAFANLLGAGRYPACRLVTSDTFLPVLTNCFFWSSEGTH